MSDAPTQPASAAPAAPSRHGVTAIVLAAGQGKRMRSAARAPKILHKALGAPIIRYPLDALDAAGVAAKILVVGVGRELIEKELAARAGLVFVTQAEQKGTGHAVACAREAAGSATTILVLAGDAPLVTGATIEGLLDTHARLQATATVLTGIVDDPRGYGRIIRTDAATPGESLIRAIVEERDATPSEREVREVNGGAYAFDAATLFRLLSKVQPTNAQGEYYLTDVIGLIVAEGGRVAARVADDPSEALGVNRRGDLARCAAHLEDRELERHMDNGVTIVAPHLTWIEVDVEIGPDTIIEPYSTIRRGVKIGAGCHVGPFAHLAEGTTMEDGAEIGNYVEVKRTIMRKKAKAKHLAYLGDGDVGPGANIGAGTIFANYDGKKKHATTIGEKAFIGSGSVLVAPANVGAGATTGAGAILTRGKTIPAGETWVGVPARPIAKTAAPRAGGL